MPSQLAIPVATQSCGMLSVMVTGTSSTPAPLTRLSSPQTLHSTPPHLLALADDTMTLPGQQPETQGWSCPSLGPPSCGWPGGHFSATAPEPPNLPLTTVMSQAIPLHASMPQDMLFLLLPKTLSLPTHFLSHHRALLLQAGLRQPLLPSVSSSSGQTAGTVCAETVLTATHTLTGLTPPQHI